VFNIITSIEFGNYMNIRKYIYYVSIAPVIVLSLLVFGKSIYALFAISIYAVLICVMASRKSSVISGSVSGEPQIGRRDEVFVADNSFKDDLGANDIIKRQLLIDKYRDISMEHQHVSGGYYTVKSNPVVKEVRKATAEEERRRKIDNIVSNVVDKHVKILAGKYVRCYSVDDYGLRSFDKEGFNEELRYFYDRILHKEICSRIDALAPSEEKRILCDVREKVENYCNILEASLTVDKNITGHEFEGECAKVLLRGGWNVEITKATGDQGVDIVGWKNGKKAVFQCKKYSKPVGNSAVQQVYAGKTDRNADLAYVVTTSSYTKEARKLAKSTNVKLLSFAELATLDV